MVVDVLAVADALGWDRFTLVGHSMGAGVASLSAAAAPERVKMVLLVEGLLPYPNPSKDIVKEFRKFLHKVCVRVCVCV